MPTIDARTWNKRNLWRRGSGELCGRPGMRKLLAPDGGKRWVGGFTIFNAYTQETWHYCFDVNTAGSKGLRLKILDENLQAFQIFSLNVDVDPRAICKGVVEGQIMITSPDFPSLFGLVGSSVRFATTVASTNPATTAIAVPSGIGIAWCNRYVVANGRSLDISDPVDATGGDLRTYVAENHNARPGVIFGLHEGAGGMLIVVTSEGVYGLDAGAAAVQVVGSNGADWRVLNHNAALSFESSCTVRGRVYGLTKTGVAPIDVESTDEDPLAEGIQPRALGNRVAMDDFRAARLLATDEGPLVCLDDQNVVHRTDLQRGLASWWSSSYAPTNLKVRGMLRDVDGTQLWLCENGIFAVDGDFEGDVALTSGVATQPTGVLFGVMPTSARQNVLVREVHAAGEAGGAAGLLRAAVRGSSKSAVPPADERGIVIGTTAWGDATKRFVTTPIANVRFSYGVQAQPPTNDIGLEVAVDGCLARISPTIDVDVVDNDSPRKVA